MYSQTNRGSRTHRNPGTRVTALALAGLLVGSGLTTQAAPPTPAARAAPAAKAAPAVAAPAPDAPILVVDGGKITGQTTLENARKEGLTVVDLSDDWLPFVFSETPDKPQPMRPFLLDLANGRYRSGK